MSVTLLLNKKQKEKKNKKEKETNNQSMKPRKKLFQRTDLNLNPHCQSIYHLFQLINYKFAIQIFKKKLRQREQRNKITVVTYYYSLALPKLIICI